MNNSDFNQVVSDTFKMCENTLYRKGSEYSDIETKVEADRLSQFKLAAMQQGIYPTMALGGMMIKHTTSIYDMLRRSKDESFPLTQWNEKIIDHINYLLLLKALIVEETNNV